MDDALLNEAKAIISALRAEVCVTDSQRHVFDWAADVAAHFVTEPDAIDDRAKKQLTLRAAIAVDLAERLGYQLSEIARVTHPDERRKALSEARTGVRLAEKLAGIVGEDFWASTK